MNNSDDMGQAEAGASATQAGMPGYHTPGADSTMQSSSQAIPVPEMTQEERLQDPEPLIQSIHETPGDANPALRETIGMEQGTVSTAELLAAREAGEERLMRQAGEQIYQDATNTTGARDMESTDTGRPNWPDDRREDPAEYMTSPRADAPFGAGSSDKFDLGFKGRVDAMIDRDSTQASAGESRSGLPAVGFTGENDQYENREFDRPDTPSDMDTIAPGMVNLPPEDGK